MILREEDASLGFLCPDGAVTTAMPICNVCKQRVPGTGCKKFGERPMKYRRMESRECEYLEYDLECFSFQRYAELYPEEVRGIIENGKG